MTLRCETITPAGVRVEPEVYCRYAGPCQESSVSSGVRVASTSTTSTSMTDGAGRPPCGLAYLFTSATAADVVSSIEGALSVRADSTRWSCTPIIGTESGTAIMPACSEA